MEQFKDLYLEELGGGDAQEHIDHILGKTKGRRLAGKVIENQLQEFVKNPFFLNVLIDAYKEDSKNLPKTKADFYKLFIERSYKKEKADKKVPVAANHSFEESVVLLERVALGMSLMNAQSLSKEDIKVTETLMQIGKIMAITVVDHIIIGNNQYYSFYEFMNK